MPTYCKIKDRVFFTKRRLNKDRRQRGNNGSFCITFRI